jgi:hypothetical protein
MATPTPMARKIHKVRYLSRNVNFFLSFAGAQSVADVLAVL